MSSHEEETVCEDQYHKRMRGKGGDRQRLKHIDGDVSACMRKHEEWEIEIEKTKRRWKEKVEAYKYFDTLTEAFHCACEAKKMQENRNKGWRRREAAAATKPKEKAAAKSDRKKETESEGKKPMRQHH